MMSAIISKLLLLNIRGTALVIPVIVFTWAFGGSALCARRYATTIAWGQL